MKKITMRRRMLSLTLAASVALPQASSAFAASLWNEDGENDRITQAIETSVPDTQESSMPWITLPPDDKNSQPSEVTVDPSTGSFDEGMEGILLDGDRPEPPSMAQDDETTPAPGTGSEESTSPAGGAVPSDTGSGSDPAEAQPAPEVTTPVTTPIDIPENDPETDPETTPEEAPDREVAMPEEGEETAGLTAPETVAPEELEGTEKTAEELVSASVDALSSDISLLVAPEGSGLSQWMNYRIGYGLSINKYSGRVAVAALDEHFAVETSDSTTNYGYREREYVYNGTSGTGINVRNPKDDPVLALPELQMMRFSQEEHNRFSFCVFPSGTILGRVPDQQFEGWYVYPSRAKSYDYWDVFYSGTTDAKRDELMEWYYGDLAQTSVTGEMKRIETYPYESGDPGYDAYGSYGGIWDGGYDYGYGYVYMRDANGDFEHLSFEGWHSLNPGLGNINNFEQVDPVTLLSTVFDPVSIVGNWVASAESRASDIKLTAVVDKKLTELTLYSSDITGKNLSEATPATFQQGENSGRQEYWLRVPADVSEFDLDLSTIELYYKDYVTDNMDDYDSYRLDTAKSHVQVTATFGGVTTSYTSDLSAQMLPKWTMNSGNNAVPGNSLDTPAHSEWAVSGIPLSNATEGSLYNDITVTVTSPSGEVTTTYIFHVQRLTDSTLTQSPGNTPMGMIYRDRASGGALSSTSAVEKAEAYFEANRKFDRENNTYPSGSANQNGVIFRDTYNTYAWPAGDDGDVDLNKTAIVVYQDSSFKDPGITLTDSEGKPVNITAGNVSRSLMLKQVETLRVKQIGEDDAGEECWYRNGQLWSRDDLSGEDGEFSPDLTFETIHEANGSDVIDLRGKNILPGIYTIEYRYFDPVSGKTYGPDSTYATEAGKNGAPAFRRTLVVLPTPGDVDMDGAVTMADSVALQGLLGTLSGHTTLNGKIIKTAATEEDTWVHPNDLASLFAYRVCDIDHDGVVGQKDVELLAQLPNPKTINETDAHNSDYFYIPLPTGVNGDRYTRQPLTVETTGPRLEMVYLGKEGGSLREGGFLESPTGPWNALPATSTDDNGNTSVTNGVTMDDIFWMGVKLTGTEGLDLESVKSFTFTLAYDPRYLEPVTVLNESNWTGVVAGATDETEQAQRRWEAMMRIYNLNNDSKGHTVWGNGWEQSTGSPYGLTAAAGRELQYTTHYSTATIPLEASATQRDPLKSITFSVELQSGKAPVLLKNTVNEDGTEDGTGYLFAVPFRLVRHPFGQQTARLVEFEAGMRSFTLVGTGGTTYAYSCQEEIFGGSTKDLAGLLSYGNLGAEIPLGEDKTEVYQIYNYNHDGQTDDSNSTVNGVYATSFLSRGGRTASGEYLAFTLGAALSGELPPGLTYNRANGYIDGTPSKAGTYEFYIGSIPYRLVIEKADLHFWADSQSSYYGQTEFRGTASPDFTFRYATGDICSFELARAAESEKNGGTIRADGNGAGLLELLDDDPIYRTNQPTFTAVISGNNAVTIATPVGNYALANTLEPLSTNYNFIYSPDMAGGNTGLTILSRPIQVVHINGTEEKPTVVGEVYSDQPGSLGNRKAQQGSGIASDQITFTVRLATTNTDAEGYYNGLPLTPISSYQSMDGVILNADSLEITYSADYIRDQGDIDQYGASSGLFFLNGSMEGYRDVQVREIRLTGGEGMSNYRLVSNGADEPVVTNGVVGKVLLRRILALRISQLPPLEYQYGDRFTQSNELHYYIQKDGDVTEGQYRFSDSSAAGLGITVYWATAEEKECYQNGLYFDYENNNSYEYRGYTDQIFTMKYNGRYLCLATPSVDEEGNSITLRRYADSPLVVRPRDLILTATSSHRYYGEEKENLAFTYDPAQLAAVDRTTGLTGAGEELLTVLAKDNYTAPTLEAVLRPMDPARVTDADRLNRTTRYTGSANSVLIHGAKSDNYRFLYRYTDETGSTTTQERYGASPYRIERRPIVVEEIVKTEPLSEIYADTHRIYTDNLTLSLSDVLLDLPEHTETATSYYPARGNSSVAQKSDIGFQVTSAVVNNDQISFTYTATVVPTDGDEYVKYVDFSHGYFNLTDVEAYKDYPVQVSNLRLVGADANNYTLVYKGPDKGMLETVNQTLTFTGAINPEVNAGATYYAAAVSDGEGGHRMTGRVWLRPIEKIEIISTGRMGYIYGETYDPVQGDREVQNSRGMVIHIEYRNDEKNNYALNPTIGEVTFRTTSSTSSGVVTTFDNRSLKIYYVKTGQTVKEAIGADQELKLSSPLNVAEHDLARIVVTGQRGGQEELIVSDLTQATLRITPKTLTLTAQDQRRVYGEANPAQFGSTFRVGDLAQWDRETLGVSGTTGANTQLDGARLGELGFAYVAPIFGTDATPGSDVLNGGQAGYDIEMKMAGSLENYTLQYAPGTLYVYPRPIRIDSFISDGEDPIYTIFSDVTGRIFWTNVDQKRFNLLLPGSGSYSPDDGTGALPVTGSALYGEDEMILSIRVDFPTDLDLHGTAAQSPIAVAVTNASIVAGTRAASNYRLETRTSAGNQVATIVNGSAIGKVELRNISTITIVHAPDKMTYTYGEALDLAGLQVRIDYSTGAGSGTEQGSELVTYMGREQFEEHGLHVYYYDQPTLKENEYWGDVNSDYYRMAATGDHLTIAFTHDSQLKGPRFAANGMYLVVTAQRHESQEASEPKIVYDPTKPNEGPIPITVDPLPITFTLSAEDKIYNGNTQAAGTITFTNIFDKSGMVDSMNTNGVTDLVYPVIGADYEETWTSGRYTTQTKFNDFKDYVARNGYSFTTGSYVANDPSILTENKTLNWTAGYSYDAAGVLKFSYLDPNVAYAQATDHDYFGNLTTKVVQATGLRLAGPDAANYTLVGQRAGETVAVTTDNAATAQGYLGSGLPTATIHKANRAAVTDELLPQVEIDPHTNVVRIIYDQSTAVIAGQEESAHRDELHFEFALQQVVTDEGTTQEPAPEEPGGETEDGEETGTETLSAENGVTVTGIVQWAGQKGDETWADPRYFGGEAAPMTDMSITSEDPEAGEYVPKEDDIPKEDSITENTAIQGQIYQWSALDDGFVLDPDAYPGGVIWPGYELYKTDRTALERDAVYLAVIRAAETHNYNASPALSSVEGYTPAMIQTILEAQQAKDRATTSTALEQAQQALDRAIQDAAEPLERAVLEARQAAQDEVDILMAAGEKDSKLEERPVREVAASVKTYKQVIETVSLKELQSERAENGAEPYQVPTLEAVWFTDVEEIPSREVLDAVVWNMDPVRYRTYAWDKDFSAELTFDEKEEPISLRTPFEVEVTTRREDGGEEAESTMTVNEDHNARLYVDTTFPSSDQTIKVEQIVLRPGSIMAVLGDKPVELGVTLYPARARASKILWTSSDTSVAVVDERGWVTFLGAGTAVITATVPGSYLGAPPQCSASITVTVVESWAEEYPNSIFDFGHMEAFLLSGDGSGEDGETLFMPEAGMTRGEVARLLAQFYVENPTWSKIGPNDFPDLAGDEDYAEAAKLLGSLGVFLGYPEGDFGGEQYISRAEFVTLLVRMTGLEVEDTTGQPHAFLDTGEEDTWAYAEIDALSRQPGILLGVGEGRFEPGRSITRSEVATLLTRLLRFPLGEAEELIVPVDVAEDHWARDHILRAVNGSQVLEESLVIEAP